MTGLDPSSARARYDDLQALVRFAREARPGLQVGPNIAGLMRDLFTAGFDTSLTETGQHGGEVTKLDRWFTPGEAAAAVGMADDRRVRRLCEAGAIRARRTTSGRWLVDLADLHRHLRGEPAAS